MDDVNTFNLSGSNRGKEGYRGKGGVDVTVIITNKTTFMVNPQPVTV